MTVNGSAVLWSRSLPALFLSLLITALAGRMRGTALLDSKTKTLHTPAGSLSSFFLLSLGRPNPVLVLQVLIAAVLAASQVAGLPVAPAPYPAEAYPDIAPNYNVSLHYSISIQ